MGHSQIVHHGDQQQTIVLGSFDGVDFKNAMFIIIIIIINLRRFNHIWFLSPISIYYQNLCARVQCLNHGIAEKFN
jgi:hypothetical protein